jgi:tetratricopeptide repeat protein 8
MRALTEQVYVDEVEIDEDGIAEMMDENSVAQISRPGTSLKTAQTASQNSLSMAMRYAQKNNFFFNSFKNPFFMPF